MLFQHADAVRAPPARLGEIVRLFLFIYFYVLARSNSAIKWPGYEAPLVLLQPDSPVLVLIMMLRLPW